MQKIVKYKNYGKCIKFEENGVVVMVTIDVGPRIIYFGDEKTNLLKEDTARKVQVYNEAYNDTWYLYGGHRLWKSPEDICTYVADNRAVSYIVNEHGGTFVSNIDPKFDYCIKINIEGNKVFIENIIISKSKKVETISEPLKIGLFLNTPEAEYSVKGMKFRCKFREENSTGKYGDFMSNLEVYTSGDILEIEGLSSVRELKCGESVKLYEEWTLIK